MAAQSYNASSIQVLEDLEHIRLRPGMYIGSQDSEGIRQILKELVDNVLDEWMEGFASSLLVEINTVEHTFRVVDDGRGIPVEKHEKTGESTLITVFTNLQAGGKFSKDSYAISVGLHGVGLKATNALSDTLTVHVWRKGHCYEQSFAKGDPTTKKPLKVKSLNKRGKHGTEITFHPDPVIFGDSQIDIPRVTSWLDECVHLCPGLSLKFVVDGEVKKDMQSGGLDHMVADMASQSNSAGLHAPVVVSSDTKDVSAAFLWSEGEGDHWFSACNASATPEGGKHVDGCLKAVAAALGPYAKKRKVDAKDLVDGLYAAVHVLVEEPQFKSQTKSRLLNSEVRDSVYDVVYPQLKSFFDQNKKLADSIVVRASQIRKARDSYKKLRQAINKKVVKKDAKGVLPDKLVEVLNCKPEHRELFLVEGDSAGGSAKVARDTAYQEVLPLKGKIPNAIQRADSLVMNNAEIASIITATGVRLGEDGKFSDLSNVRVGRVLLLMDADADGCFPGDTRVKLLDGSSFSFVELAERYPNGESFWVYSLDTDGKVVPGRAHSVRITKEVSKLVEVHLDSGEVIRCTPDHLFCVKASIHADCSRVEVHEGLPYIKAKDLLEDDSLGLSFTEVQDYNHRVALVSEVSLTSPISVYDLTVDTYCNFALDSGVFVHNSHISSLVLSFFCKWIPDMVREGYLYIVRSPLFVGNYKGKRWFASSLPGLYAASGLDHSKLLVSRLKGHGEVSREELKYYAMDPKTRKLWKVSLGKEDTDVISSLMGTDSQGRKSLFGL